jgi:hypothetical protein
MLAVRRQQASKGATTRPKTGALHPRDESRGFRSQISVTRSIAEAEMALNSLPDFGPDTRVVYPTELSPKTAF